MPTRRRFVQAGGALIASLAHPAWWGGLAGAPSAEVVDIAMRSDPSGATVWFDPVGVLVAPHTTVRWVIKENVHTTTAYHPKNGNHSLRIPEGAEPWDSGFLVNPGDHFEVSLTVPGVYDFFCTPHEPVGMVGRIIVMQATGPGAEPFDYFTSKPMAKDWLSVPDAARTVFPTVAQIVKEHVVHRTP